MDEMFTHPNPGGLRPNKRFEWVADALLSQTGKSDQRVGQLIVNALRANGLTIESLWHIEDKALAEMIRSL